MLVPSIGSAQHYNFRQISVNEGLPSSTIWWVTQDSEGFIWFGTSVGASRFNGKDFFNLSIDDGLTGSEVFTIMEDYEGRIWFMPFRSNLCYLYEDSIHEFCPEAELKNSVSERLLLTRDSIMYLSSSQGIVRIEDDTIAGRYDQNQYKGLKEKTSQITNIWENKEGKIRYISQLGHGTLSDAELVFENGDCFGYANPRAIEFPSGEVWYSIGPEVYSH